jgi:hypothetical protein
MAKYTKPDYSEQWASAVTLLPPTVLKYKQGILLRSLIMNT